ncbi:formate dehydrogenase subunit gamma [Polynucleobacter sp. AP-Jannik-300A-C4]|uniref:formate dehydrogenase subunit gamma n=1 Tax=Polynucleobacter sp. AP-Jannik-300A-C4 TaxID=2576928 RepID=UPI001BFEAFC5|nr:formate dehydrogenase subunit gamma [Polynucleobacter sp. AP-Jannik-300A-C4]QWE21909.1 formate dehydrogenase subunit gamma [Polynucleobacter sp. AP-Jannik-300A-C4]
MKSFTTSDIRLWVLAAGISLSLMSGASFAQQPNAAALPKVESANIMDIGRAADASPQAQIEAAKNQPGNNAPIWRTVNSDTPNFVNGPVTERGVLIQKSGQQWRLIRNGVITVFGAWLLAFAFFGVLAMYVLRGPIKLHEPLSGTKIKRFTDLERYTHWTMAFSFVALAFTGLLILYGKFFALPVMGGTLFGIFLFICKNIHNFVGPLFTLSIIVFFFLFVRKNMLEPDDMAWIKSFGGLLSGKHVPSGFFNFGEKFWFWFGMVFLGLIISASGWVLDMIVPVPGIEYWRGTMQLADIIHASAALLMTAMAMGHIYIGTIGMQGSIDGMKTGYVDAAWAKEHHEIWYNKVK